MIQTQPLSKHEGLKKVFVPLFGKENLRRSLIPHRIIYEWRGDVLGAFSEIDESSIRRLAIFQNGKTVFLLCMEADSDRCHRKTEIARRLEAYGIEATYLYVGLIGQQ